MNINEFIKKKNQEVLTSDLLPGETFHDAEIMEASVKKEIMVRSICVAMIKDKDFKDLPSLRAAAEKAAGWFQYVDGADHVEVCKIFEERTGHLPKEKAARKSRKKPDDQDGADTQKQTGNQSNNAI
jgi:glutamate mutase epsilon subunit